MASLNLELNDRGFFFNPEQSKLELSLLCTRSLYNICEIFFALTPFIYHRYNLLFAGGISESEDF